MSVPTCKRCGHPIRWIITPKARRMPIDSRPVPDGNVVIDEVMRTGDWRGHVLTKSETPMSDRYMAHAATCPVLLTSRRREKYKVR